MQGARSTGTLIECLSPLEGGTEDEERERRRHNLFIYSRKEFEVNEIFNQEFNGFIMIKSV